MDKPLWGLRVLKFDGAIAPRVLKFDSGSAAEGCGRARSRGAAGIGDRDRGSGSPAGQQSSGVGQPTIGRPFYVQAKGQLRLTWRPSAGSPQSEGSRYTPIVNHLSINTSRRGGAFLYSRRGLRLWRRGAYGIHRACRPDGPLPLERSEHNPPPAGGHNPRGQRPRQT